MEDKSVVNLSNVVLTKDQVSVLCKGLKFCPTPGLPDPGVQREDLDKLHRRLRQIAYYYNPVDSLSQPSQPVVATMGNSVLEGKSLVLPKKRCTA
jgi:hypothetical protein